MLQHYYKIDSLLKVFQIPNLLEIKKQNKKNNMYISIRNLSIWAVELEGP